MYFLPAVVPFPGGIDVVLTAMLTVYCGSWRSPTLEGPKELMTRKDALQFPLVGSVVLMSLYLVYKFLPPDIVNLVASLYFAALGVFAIAGMILPFVEKHFSAAACKQLVIDRKLKFPFMDEIAVEVTRPQLAAAGGGLVAALWYVVSKHWMANNLMGLAFSITGIEHIKLGSTTNGFIMLTGLFFYDIFWVFCTPVMVTVATSFEAPIKLLFPRVMSEAVTRPFALLGLGDIVVPGLFVSLMYRYDVSTHFATSYFQSAFWGYSAGLAMTMAVMYCFKAAQPALLYIVPCILAAVAAHAYAAGDLKKLSAFEEEGDEAAEGATPGEKDGKKAQ